MAAFAPWYYNNGELHPLKYGSYFGDKQKLFAVIKAEEAFVLVFAGQNNRRIWVDLYQTKVDAEVVAALAAHIAAIHCKIYKRCFVGCPRRHAAGVRLYKICRGFELPLRLFTALKEAKQWLGAQAG